MRKIKHFAFVLATLSMVACSNPSEKSTKQVDATTIPVEGEEMAELTSPPMVPKPIGNRPAKKLIVHMEILEEEGEMTNGVSYVYWTFGGTVPGSFIRTRVGDEIEFHLKTIRTINYRTTSTYTQLQDLAVALNRLLLLRDMKRCFHLKY